MNLTNEQPRKESREPSPQLERSSSSNSSSSSSSARRTARGSAPWTDILKRSDVSRLWTELNRLVCHHPLVRATRRAGLLVQAGEGRSSSAHTDLTQELFVTLLGKERFQHYLDTEMSDHEVECEISQIELTNLLTAELRKQHPESYRLARRISTIIQSSHNFRRFDTTGSEDEPYRRLADRLYGLTEWVTGKPRRATHELEQRVKMIPMRQRDTRLVGCTGDSQVIISNPDLEDLVISVLEAADSPLDVRALRSLVMSRLPVMDIYLVPLSANDDDERARPFEPVDLEDTPEERLLRSESEQEAAGFVDKFLGSLHQAVRGKAKQYDRMIGVLWYCYLCPQQTTQLEAAAQLGVSDSLVSDYRRRIEEQLRALSLTEVEEARQFEAALREHVRALVNTAEAVAV